MKDKTLLFLFALGVFAAACGFSSLQSVSDDLVACCDPATDPDCEPGNNNNNNNNNSDSMPATIVVG